MFMPIKIMVVTGDDVDTCQLYLYLLDFVCMCLIQFIVIIIWAAHQFPLDHLWMP